ncbi:hypothetical protein JDV02_008798 [Purpureocillium takamizusanense]|uniref:2EXR domain-containing protein n=1 Tax=Purpureocillium takamizusanense TaxID=2060973 RepID=A0A9Q8VDN1_9HYPO|nr:uncharacterized protein JDV02_008798 [Purpureocillium takamizusanense]UNI22955.1 hypothetical protein JDV02_008798 [Purpureocillium takamizusanense]
MAASPCDRFFVFSKLPLEIRLLIWRAALPDVDGPVLLPYKTGCLRIPRPSISDEGYDATAGNRLHMDFCHNLLDKALVTTPLASVNREARGASLSWMRREIKATEVRLGRDNNNLCSSFARPFDPGHDALYVGTDKLHDFCVEPYDSLTQPDIAELQVSVSPCLVPTTLAVPEAVFRRDGVALFEILQWYSGITVILVVVGAQPQWQDDCLTKVQPRWGTEVVRGYGLSWNRATISFDVVAVGDVGDLETYGWLIDDDCQESAVGLVGELNALEIRAVRAVRR